MLFYDFEVFKYDWLVVINNTDDKSSKVIVNEVDELRSFYNKHKKDIWVGYNSRNYDQWILKALLCGFKAQEMNNWIIKEGKSPYDFSSLLQEIELFNYDTQIRMDRSLKQLEGFMGSNIKESSIPFDIQRPLTEAEILETIKYCTHDVEQTMLVFAHSIDEFNAHIGLLNAFKLPMRDLNKTKAQLSAKILGARKIERNDEFDLHIVPYIQLSKYRYVQKWYENLIEEVMRDEELQEKLYLDDDFKKQWYKEHKLVTDIMGVKHTFAFGGLHGALPKYVSKGFLVNSDVRSYYPSEMIEYNFLSRNVAEPKRFTDIYNYRIQLKKEGKKKEQQPYKIVLNGTYGASKAKFNQLYDPRQANNVCMNGQLMLLDLIEHVEKAIPNVKLVQSNTDGVMFELPDPKWYDIYVSVCDDWTKRTRMILEHDRIKLVIQKDVNNYCIIINKGDGKEKIKSKGSWLKERSVLDYDVPILYKALLDYFMNEIPVEKTINECNDLIEFQQIVKVSNKYKCAAYAKQREDKTLYECEYFPEKVYRVFASKYRLDKGLFKIKPDGSVAKFAGTSPRVFIDNSNIIGKKVPRRLDKNFYINLLKERIKAFNC